MLKKPSPLRIVVCAVLFIAIALLSFSCSKNPDEPQQQNTDDNNTTNPQTTENTADENTTDTAVQEHPQGWVPIPLELPRPMFRGTPQDIPVPNLEKPLGKPRPPFYAPVGTENVAFGKPVSASNEDSIIIGELDLVTDGDKEATDGSYVEMPPLLQQVTIDLEAEYEIYAVIVWHYHSQPRAYLDVIVQFADDADFITNVKTIFNNDHDNSAGLGVGKDMNYVETSEGKLIEGKGQKARYVRLYSNGNSFSEMNHYIEVEVYGKAAK